MKLDSSFICYALEEGLLNSDTATLLGVFKLYNAAKFEFNIGDFEPLSTIYEAL